MSDIDIFQAGSDVGIMQAGLVKASSDAETQFEAAGALIGAVAGGAAGFLAAGTAAGAVGTVNPVAGGVVAVGILPATYVGAGCGAVAGQKIAKACEEVGEAIADTVEEICVALDEISDQIAEKIVDWVDNL